MKPASLEKNEIVISRTTLRGAMKLFHNLEKLGQAPLAGLRIVGERRKAALYAETPHGRGLALRGILSDAFESLKSLKKKRKNQPDEGQVYRLVVGTYLHDKNRSYLINTEAIDHQTYHRRVNAGLDRMVDKLREWEEKARASQRASRQLAESLIPARPPYDIVGRKRLLETIKDQLISGNEGYTIALYGGPGFGKTALAVELAHNSEIKDYFQDGILWAGLGEAPDILGHVNRWGGVLDISAEKISNSANPEERGKTLRREIGSARMLLIIDDVWNFESARDLKKVGGPNCAYLITTRNPDIANQLASENALIVPELDETDSQKLIEKLAPKAYRLYPTEIDQWLKEIRGMPLALVVGGHVLDVKSDDKDPRQLKDAVQQLSKLESIAARIERSEEMLDDNARQALRALTLFPPKPNSFSKKAALAISTRPIEILDTLLAWAFLESPAEDRYSMHPIIRSYAGSQMKSKAVDSRMVDFYLQYIDAHRSEYRAFEVEIKNIATALDRAYLQKMRPQLVQGVNSLYWYFDTRGLYPTARLHLVRALKFAKFLSDPTARVRTRHHLGQIDAKLGKYTFAKRHFQLALKNARQMKAEGEISALLNGLGNVQDKLGEPDDAEKSLKEALGIARAIDDRARIASILTALGGIESNRSNYKQAEQYLAEGLRLARELDNQELASSLQATLGTVKGRQSQLPQATRYFEGSLAIARRLGNRNLICLLHLQLGTAHDHLGHISQARKYYSEALRIATEIEDKDKRCFAHLNLGVLEEHEGHNEEAEEHFQDALRLAREMQHAHRICSLLINLGGLEISRKNYPWAEKHLTEGLERARELKLPHQIVNALKNLGVLFSEVENFREARNFLQKALAQARKYNDPENECDVLIELGNMYIARKQFDTARASLEQALKIAQDRETPDLAAQALLRLSQIEARHGDRTKAIDLAQQSLAIFKTLKHKMMPEVRRFANELKGKRSRV